MANNLFQQVRTDVKNFQSTESMLFSNESDQQLRLSCYLKLLGHYDRVEVEYYGLFSLKDGRKILQPQDRDMKCGKQPSLPSATQTSRFPGPTSSSGNQCL